MSNANVLDTMLISNLEEGKQSNIYFSTEFIKCLINSAAKIGALSRMPDQESEGGSCFRFLDF